MGAFDYRGLHSSYLCLDNASFAQVRSARDPSGLAVISCSSLDPPAVTQLRPELGLTPAHIDRSNGLWTPLPSD